VGLLEKGFGLVHFLGFFAELVALGLHFGGVLLGLLVLLLQGVEEALQHHLGELEALAVLFVD
jgi:hypothetical protein